MKTLTTTVALALLTVTFAPASLADHPRHRDHRPGHGEGAEYARVLHAEPIVRRFEVREPARECREERVGHAHRSGYRGDAAGPMIVGGIIGGMIGHELGHGRDAATLLGTLIGTSLAHDAAHRPGRGGYETVYEERCRIVHRTRVEERIDGYRVTYRHRGGVHTTRLPYDPGPTVRINIDVR
ncbi:MAG: hypothetical protein IPK65_07000 [Gammaproteobacteria bacterium]|nr:hypothetical protein [Gammaproteobacteria bacterium]